MKQLILTLCCILLFSGLLTFNYIKEVSYPPSLSFCERVSYSWKELDIARFIELSHIACRPINSSYALYTLFLLNHLPWVIIVAFFYFLHPWFYYSFLLCLSLPLVINWKLLPYVLARTILIILTLMILILLFSIIVPKG